MTRIYISGPMSGLPGHNFPAFDAAEVELKALGYDVFNPAERGITEGWSWADYLRDDLAELLKCDEVAVLPGGWASRGATLEIHVANELGMDVRRLADHLTSGETAEEGE